MPPRSTVFHLDAATREELDRRIIASGFGGYAEHAELFAAQGHAISRPALQRYGKRLKRHAENGGPTAQEAAVEAIAGRLQSALDGTFRSKPMPSTRYQPFMTIAEALASKRPGPGVVTSERGTPEIFKAFLRGAATYAHVAGTETVVRVSRPSANEIARKSGAHWVVVPRKESDMMKDGCAWLAIVSGEPLPVQE